MKNLARIIIGAIAFMCCTIASAQIEGDSGVGVNFGYQAGNLNMSNAGIGIKYNYMITDALRMEIGGTYYFKGSAADVPYINDKVSQNKNLGYRSNKDTDWFDVELNAHYLFNVAEQVNVYPIFGFSAMFGNTKFNIADKGITLSNLRNTSGKFYESITEDVEGETALKENYSDHHFSFGVNLGFGGQYEITDDFALTLEAKYRLATNKCSNFNIALGCVVLF